MQTTKELMVNSADREKFTQQVLTELSALVSQLPQEISQVTLDYIELTVFSVFASILFYLLQKIRLDPDERNYKDMIKVLSWLIPLFLVYLWSEGVGLSGEDSTIVFIIACVFALFLSSYADAVARKPKQQQKRNQI